MSLKNRMDEINFLLYVQVNMKLLHNDLMNLDKTEYLTTAGKVRDKQNKN